MEQFIEQRNSVEDFLVHYKDADFDPEFYTQYLPSIIEAYNAQFGTNLKPKKKSWKRILSVQK